LEKESRQSGSGPSVIWITVDEREIIDDFMELAKAGTLPG